MSQQNMQLNPLIRAVCVHKLAYNGTIQQHKFGSTTLALFKSSLHEKYSSVTAAFDIRFVQYLGETWDSKEALFRIKTTNPYS